MLPILSLEEKQALLRQKNAAYQRAYYRKLGKQLRRDRMRKYRATHPEVEKRRNLRRRHPRPAKIKKTRQERERERRIRNGWVEGTRYCQWTKTWVPEENFVGSPSPGLCRDCYPKSQANKRLKKNEYRRGRKRKNFRLKAVAFLGSKCSDPGCRWLNEDGTFGCKVPGMLDIDHMNNDGKIEREKYNHRQICRRILNSVPGYQLLCANCHKMKTFAAVQYEK